MSKTYNIEPVIVEKGVEILIINWHSKDIKSRQHLKYIMKDSAAEIAT